MRTLKIQPTRLDAYRASSPINPTEGSTQNQRHWAWVYKGEFNKVLSDSAVRRSSRRAVRLQLAARAERERAGPRIEDLSNSIVSGPNRDWRQKRRRNQVLGSVTLLQGWLPGQPRSEVWRRGLSRNVVRGVAADVVRQHVDLLHAQRRAVGSRSVRCRRDQRAR